MYGAEMSQRKDQFAFRAEKPLAERIKSYKQTHNLTQSDALRELVRLGLDADELSEQHEELEARVERLESQISNSQDSGGFFSFLK